MSIDTLGLPREATIQLSDVFGPLPVDGMAIPPPTDFDAEITAQIRNTGRFHDGCYGLSDGSRILGNYGAVLIADLRAQQLDAARQILHGHTDSDPPGPHLHPDEIAQVESLHNSVVAIINSADRRSDHHQTGQNGDHFYVATTKDQVEFYAQAHLLSALDARGRIQTLHHIPDGVFWPEGEQFRSSIVSSARSKPEMLAPIQRGLNWPIPLLPDCVQLAYIDKFANIRLQTPRVERERNIMASNELVRLVLEDGRVALDGIHVVTRLTGIPENEIGIYVNPADDDAQSGPAYLELVRRVSDCNGDSSPRAYHVLVPRISKLLKHHINLSDWASIGIRLEPSQPRARRRFDLRALRR